ncbi:S9 family peptidase [Rathayibacter toxicus]|uniref:S9 family peptidase n=1 Tax=Rathayibacter toxicus TaxID=145458 RepID=UPI000CE8060A|nr:S9 family peptidase [Rathayibacter toxicus]PPI54187.1 oligopeptidase B [Rathayibacter toxicus]QOD11115.1 S9 family peptidase [Rathayibacter toxicus]QWL27858.1 S9 family peptidase [Rathayibacter toxicus]QWL29974.1 S9 family peptidase [Rathayibacter toxicus]QWL32066.1 S9 family peptidase [Rathayibacter toxicus]
MTTPAAPVARRVPQERRHHGDVVMDPYEWLRQKDAPEVIAHLEAENAYTEAVLSPLAPLRETLFTEIRSRTQETDLSVPVREGSWWYFSRYFEGRPYAVHCRTPIRDPDDWTPPGVAEGGSLDGEQVVLDSNVEADGHDFFSLGSFDISRDGRYLLYGTDTEGDERYTLRIRNLTTGTDLDDRIEGTGAGATFGADASYVFYPTVDQAWRPDTIWRHLVGTDSSADDVVFAEPDERYWISIGLTRSRRFLIIDIASKITSECLLLDAQNPTGEFRSVWPRREGVEYEVEHAVINGRDRLLIVHNDGALDFALVEEPVDVGRSFHERAQERKTLLPHRLGRRIEGVDAFAGHVVVSYRSEGTTRLGLLRDDGDDAAQLDEIVFDEPLYDAGLAGNPEWAQPDLRLSYTSFVTPATVLSVNVTTGERTVLKQQPVLGEYDPERYRQRREWATAQDGTRIPLSLVWHEGAADPDRQPAPLLLYGYGSYETSIDPSFSIARLSLLDRGVVFAIAHVRGGGEMGRSWYEQGKMLAKRTTFTDFIDAAQHLVRTGLTTADQLVAQGGSAGGLLMGAAANLAPEAFAGILAQVPFVDALTSVLDPSLPLTVIEWDEWGDPLHDAEVYTYLKSYSPYENVRENVRYPRILATTSLNDTRVLYVEPTKWVARLRDVGAPALLKIDMSGGHGGVSGRYERWRETAFEYAWILDVLGLA